jgi:microcystin-dependent protein
MSEPFLGQVCTFGFNFAPRGWAFCNGQILPIAQNTALFSLLGTTYGGNGTTTFALPNLQSRVPVHFGTGAGLSNYALGQQGGTETNTLIVNQLPAHSHPLTAHGEDANSTNPSNNRPAAATGSPPPSIYSNAAADTNMQPTGNTGSNQPIGNIQPYLALNFCIALEGIYPSRN